MFYRPRRSYRAWGIFIPIHLQRRICPFWMWVMLYLSQRMLGLCQLVNRDQYWTLLRPGPYICSQLQYAKRVELLRVDQEQSWKSRTGEQVPLFIHSIQVGLSESVSLAFVISTVRFPLNPILHGTCYSGLVMRRWGGGMHWNNRYIYSVVPDEDYMFSAFREVSRTMVLDGFGLLVLGEVRFALEHEALIDMLRLIGVVGIFESASRR